MPPIVYTSDVMRGLFPTELFDFVSQTLGVSNALDGFTQTRDHGGP